jgi:hypothetical protein
VSHCYYKRIIGGGTDAGGIGERASELITIQGWSK